MLLGGRNLWFSKGGTTPQVWDAILDIYASRLQWTSATSLQQGKRSNWFTLLWYPFRGREGENKEKHFWFFCVGWDMLIAIMFTRGHVWSSLFNKKRLASILKKGIDQTVAIYISSVWLSHDSGQDAYSPFGYPPISMTFLDQMFTYLLQHLVPWFSTQPATG